MAMRGVGRLRLRLRLGLFWGRRLARSRSHCSPRRFSQERGAQASTASPEPCGRASGSGLRWVRSSTPGDLVSKELLDAVKKAALSAIFSQGVKLAREGAVLAERQSDSEAVLRVRAPGRAAYLTV